MLRLITKKKLDLLLETKAVLAERVEGLSTSFKLAQQKISRLEQENRSLRTKLTAEVFRGSGEVFGSGGVSVEEVFQTLPTALKKESGKKGTETKERLAKGGFSVKSEEKNVFDGVRIATSNESSPNSTKTNNLKKVIKRKAKGDADGSTSK